MCLTQWPVKAAAKISFEAPEIELLAQKNLTLNGGIHAKLAATTVDIN